LSGLTTDLTPLICPSAISSAITLSSRCCASTKTAPGSPLTSVRRNETPGVRATSRSQPLKPQYEITGSGSVENKGAGDELGLEVIVSTVAHRAVPSGFVNQEATSPEFGFGDVIEMLAKASTEFAAKVCGA
jgi:hypothetical protein